MKMMEEQFVSHEIPENLKIQIYQVLLDIDTHVHEKLNFIAL